MQTTQALQAAPPNPRLGPQYNCISKIFYPKFIGYLGYYWYRLDHKGNIKLSWDIHERVKEDLVTKKTAININRVKTYV